MKGATNIQQLKVFECFQLVHVLRGETAAPPQVQHFGLEWTMETGGWTNPNTLFKHYKGLATKEEAEAFYSILPLE